jgi:hypothetical protein
VDRDALVLRPTNVKVPLLQALASQYRLLCNIIDRNAMQREKGEQHDDEAVVPLPFILLQAGPRAVLDVRLSQDQQDAVLDYDTCVYSDLREFVSECLLFFTSLRLGFAVQSP